MKKIKIAFVETNCKKNGPIKQTLNIIKYMDRAVFEPVLITIWPEQRDNSLLDEYKQQNVSTYSIGLSKIKSVVFGKFRISKLLKEIKPDIVQGVGMPPYRMTLGYKDTIHFITLRNYCYDDYPDYYGKIIGKIMADQDVRLIRKNLRKNEPFVTCSESLTKMYKERLNLNIACICNGVDVGLYTKGIKDKNDLRKKLGLPQDKLILVYSGFFIDRKNQQESINAFLNMKNRKKAVLLFLGDGVDREPLQTEYGENTDIIFEGQVSNMNEFLNASDIYISSSKSEGLPNGVLEAMACGLPVVLSNIPQHMEILNHSENCGYSYLLGDYRDMSAKLDCILNSDITAMGSAAYACLLNNYTAQSMSQNYQNLYMKLYMEKRN